MTIQQISVYSLALEVESHNYLATNSIATLLAISRGIEDAVIYSELKGTFYAGFQRFSAFLPQMPRFKQLAAVCGRVLVFGFPDVAVPEIPNLEFIPLDEDAPLVQEWFIVFNHPDFNVALVTQQIGEQNPVLNLGHKRQYKGGMTLQPELIATIRRAFVDALPSESGTARIVPSTEKVPPRPYQTFFRIFMNSLERSNRQLAAVYASLEKQNKDLEELNNIVKTMMSRTAWEQANLASNQTFKAVENYRSETLSVLTTDIQGFTTMSEIVPAKQLVPSLNDYLDLLATTVYQHNGDVDKFLGDGMLAFFQRPCDAVQAAIGIQRHIRLFNERQINKGCKAFPTRIAIVTGPCLVARIGSRDRQEVTVLGDTVNTSSRLQAIGQPGWVTMDEATYLACEHPPTVPKMVKVRGKEGLQSVYQILPDDFLRVENHFGRER